MYRSEYEFYCPKCGDICFIQLNGDKKCIVCGTIMVETPHEYDLSQSLIDEIMKKGWRDNKCILEEKENIFFNEIVAKSDKFDRSLYLKKDSIKKQQYNNFSTIVNNYKESNVPKCPTCGSTNLSKITVTKKATKTFLFGIFGALDDAGKTYKCNKCGTKW